MQPLVYGWNVYALLFWIVYIVWFVLEMIGAFAQRMRAGAEKQDRGTLLTVLGIGLAMTNWASLVAILVCSFIGYFYRVLVEERVLRTSLGQPYMEYMRRTKRFVPFVF